MSDPNAPSASRAPFWGHPGVVRAVVVSPDGRQIVSGGDDGSVRVWDRASGVEQVVLTGHTGPVNAVAVTPDGRQIVSGGRDGSVRV
ncbi:WD40 repeat domain-containing protein, partial [Frankia umida]|uniref:WD40 repeat domain-containing protein n=1 Tax=Frankia umida TaxID=573489 RepID=UPI0035566846